MCLDSDFSRLRRMGGAQFERMIALETICHTTFESILGERLAMETPAGVVDLRLVEVRLLGSARPGAPREPFALLFRGVPGLRIPQGIRRFEFPTLGAAEFFITQVADGADGSEFEAVFT
jgi:hypothetical protein